MVMIKFKVFNVLKKGGGGGFRNSEGERLRDNYRKKTVTKELLI